jgi:ribosomal protein L27
MQQDPLPPGFVLGSTETDIGYVAQLPQRIDEPWGLEAVHPWFRSQLKKLLEEAAPGVLGDSPAVPIDAKRLKDSAAEFDGQIGVLSDMQLVDEPLRNGSIVAFKVKSADNSVTFPTEALGTGDQPVFVMSAAWARSLEFDNGPKRDTNCSLRVRMERIGKVPVAHILGITYPAADGGAEEELVDPSPFPFAAGGGGGDLAFRGASEMGGATLDGAEFRLFRFIDTTVKPGQRYRYRVRLSVRNPNFGIDRQHLADPTSAKNELLPSKESNETPPVSVPDATALLVKTLTKEEIKEKKLKPGSLQVLVLAPSTDTGNYTLRSLITETGGLANVDSSLNKPGDIRMKGEEVTTGRVLVDVRGRQEEPGKPGTPPETLEMLFLKDDGSCEFVSAADSQRIADRYMPTLEPPAAPVNDVPELLPPVPRRGSNK